MFSCVYDVKTNKIKEQIFLNKYKGKTMKTDYDNQSR